MADLIGACAGANPKPDNTQAIVCKKMALRRVLKRTTSLALFYAHLRLFANHQQRMVPLVTIVSYTEIKHRRYGNPSHVSLLIHL